MVKDILIGLSVGVIAGVFFVKNCKPYEECVETVSDAVTKQVKQMKKQAGKSATPKSETKTSTKETKSSTNQA